MILSRKPVLSLILFVLMAGLLHSCIPKNKFLFVFNRTSVKNPPKDTFAFANRIIIPAGIVSKDEKKRLETELDNYWDDSIKAKITQQYGIFYRIKDAHRFDTTAIQRSRVYMNSYLQSQGYYASTLKDTFTIDTFKPGKTRQQFRATTIMHVNPGKRLTIDSVAYDFIDTAIRAASDTVLERLALQKAGETVLRKGEPFYKQIIGAELDRLISWYRQNGYYRLRREHLVAHVDTTDQLIDDLTIDPFELARRIAEATERRRINPTADITIQQATQVKEIPFDPLAVTQYRFGNVYYYPETSRFELIDSVMQRTDFKVQQDSNVIVKYLETKPRFKLKLFKRHTYTTHGQLYNEKDFFRTLNAYGQMGPWSQVDYRDSIVGDTIHFHIFPTRQDRFTYKFDLELTRSTGDFISSTNLFGIGGNLSRLDRNFQRKAIQWLWTNRAGVELNPDKNEVFLQTVQVGIGHTFSIPHLVLPNWWITRWALKKEKNADVARTVINFNAAYTDRTQFFRLRSLTANSGWEGQKNNRVLTFRFPNIELYSLDTLAQLSRAFEQNPFLRTAFNTGSVIGLIVGGNSSWLAKRMSNKSKYVRGAIEYAGLPVLFSRSLEDNFYHYAKAEVEYIQKEQRPKTTLAFRLFGGIGYNIINHPVYGKSLPFFKQFVAGGPNSMRAWGLRQLGLGSSLLSDTATGFKDRFGDLQFETNIEYRFPIMSFGSVKWNSAVFFDIGNIWNIKKDPDNPASQFRFGNFLDDLAVAGGIGLARIDMGYFLIRLDFALKLRDPARTLNNGWLDLSNFTWKNTEFKNARNNYAIQIGIGMPF